MVNSRYTIGVGAVGKDGLHASYSTTGAAIFVAAPGGDDEAITNNVVAKPGGGCVSTLFVDREKESDCFIQYPSHILLRFYNGVHAARHNCRHQLRYTSY